MDRRGRHELAGEISVADAIHHMAYHDLLHLAQASNLLAEPMQRRHGSRTALWLSWRRPAGLTRSLLSLSWVVTVL